MPSSTARRTIAALSSRSSRMNRISPSVSTEKFIPVRPNRRYCMAVSYPQARLTPSAGPGGGEGGLNGTFGRLNDADRTGEQVVWWIWVNLISSAGCQSGAPLFTAGRTSSSNKALDGLLNNHYAG